MKNTRLTSIIRISILLVAALMWACSGSGTDGLSNEGIDAANADSASDAGPPVGDDTGTGEPNPSDIGQPQPDVETHGKDTEQTEDTTGEPGDATEDPDDVTEDPGDVTEDPGDVTEDPGDVTEDPGDVTEDPGDVTEDPGDVTEDPGDTIVDPGDTTEDPGDGTTAAEDAGGEADVIDDGPFACDSPDGCEEQGATTCAADGSALIRECKLSGGCLQWFDSEYCEFDDVFPNACTGNPDICVDGECVPDGPIIVDDCDETDNPCEMQVCDGVTGTCSIMMVEPGTPCDDDDVCTKDDICFGNACIGSGEDALGTPICPQDCLNPSASLTCSEYASFELNGEFGGSLMDEYSCGDAVGYTGYETAYLVEPMNLAFEMGLTLAVELSDPADKGNEFVDIIVLETSPGYQCWANTCVAMGYMDETGVATVEIPAFLDSDDDPTNDPSYIVLVDGRDGFAGPVRIASWCVPGYADIELHCTDGKDDDADGLIDCNDPSCWETLTCLFEHDCDNETDDDEDGAIDCDDNDCAEHPDCYVELSCGDGIDDEGDGYTDCEDSDCEFTPSCSNTCSDAIPLSCGDILTGQDPSTGGNTFSSFPCSPTGIGIASAEYESPHHVYHVHADEGCAARVRVSPESDDFVVMDIFAMGPGCSANHCIEIEGGADCQDPQTPGSVFGGDACVQIPESYAFSSWLTVIPDNLMLETGADTTYGIEVICDCQ